MCGYFEGIASNRKQKLKMIFEYCKNIKIKKIKSKIEEAQNQRVNKVDTINIKSSFGTYMRMPNPELLKRSKTRSRLPGLGGIHNRSFSNLNLFKWKKTNSSQKAIENLMESMEKKPKNTIFLTKKLGKSKKNLRNKNRLPFLNSSFEGSVLVKKQLNTIDKIFRERRGNSMDLRASNSYFMVQNLSQNTSIGEKDTHKNGCQKTSSSTQYDNNKFKSFIDGSRYQSGNGISKEINKLNDAGNPGRSLKGKRVKRNRLRNYLNLSKS